MTTSSTCTEPVLWAKLIAIDPLNVMDGGEDEKLKNSEKSQDETNQIEADGNVLRHVVKSQDSLRDNVYLINSESFKIGRANSCHLSIRYNKLVSGLHCIIYRDADESVWIEDKSTNGTLINGRTKLFKEKMQLHSGDTIHLVFKNNSTADNVCFKFMLIGAEEAATLEYLDETLLDEVEIPAEVTGKRSRSPSTEDPGAKKVHLDAGTGEPSTSGAVEGADDDDEIGETLLCSICQDIFHDCVSLQPCMHSFCSGCYSEWMEKSNDCPNCRLKVDRVSKNHLVNNLVNSYLKKNPQKKRAESDLKELDAKNKITHDMLYKQKSRSDSGSSTPNSDSSSDSPQPFLHGQPMPQLATYINYNPAFGRTVPTFGPPRTVCRQCPGQGTACSAAADGGSNDSDASSSGACGNSSNTDDVKSTPRAPNFVCQVGQNHILCMCCLQPMPDRRNDRVADTTIPHQQCSICYRFYCHAYWTCPKADCLGCLGKFNEMNFGRKCMTSIILDNQFESDILRDYINSKDLSVRQLLDACIVKLESGDYNSLDSTRGALRSDTVICYPCGLRNFKELAYQYRKDIDNTDLPAAVTGRPDCYWGKTCRTQKHKPHHAARFNHICEATRTG